MAASKKVRYAETCVSGCQLANTSLEQRSASAESGDDATTQPKKVRVTKKKTASKAPFVPDDDATTKPKKARVSMKKAAPTDAGTCSLTNKAIA